MPRDVRILSAHEDPDGLVHAVVEFPDDQRQSVVLPSWATKGHFILEAARMRNLNEAREAAKKHRHDLMDVDDNVSKEDRHQ